MNTPKVNNPLTELKSWLVESADRCRSMHWLGALFRIEVAQDIAADIQQTEQEAASAAYASEQYDLQAERDVDAACAELEAAADAAHVAEALKALKRARRSIELSANKDHAVSDILTPSAC